MKLLLEFLLAIPFMLVLSALLGEEAPIYVHIASGSVSFMLSCVYVNSITKR